MRRPRSTLFGAVIMATAWATPAPAATVCGPDRAQTLATSDEARVYVRAGVVRACHRDGGPVRWLGRRERALDVKVEGRRIAIRRALGAGERLTVYALRSRARTQRRDVEGSIAAMALDPRGIAALVEVTPEGDTRIRFSRGRLTPPAPGILPSSLAFRGGVVAWRDQEGIQLFRALSPTERPEKLARIGNVTLSVRDDILRYQRRGQPVVPFATPIHECTSSQGCEGVDRILVAGDFLAARTLQLGASDNRIRVAVYNLDTGGDRVACDYSIPYPQGAGSFQLTPDGAVTCPPAGGQAGRARRGHDD
jgi:hypothetical protein